MLQKSITSRHGAWCFTLIEILMVIALIAVLTGIGIGGYSYASNSAKESATRAMIKQVETALESCRVKHGFYPSKSSEATIPVLIFTTGGAEDTEANQLTKIAKKWGTDSKPIPEAYVRDFRKALDMESLREYIDADGNLCDAWGEPLLYLAPDTANKKAFSIRSKGPDGLDSTAAQKEDDIRN